MPTAHQMLMTMSEDSLRAGLQRAEVQLALIDIDEQADPGNDFDGPFPPSKAYENYSASFNTEMRRKLNLAKDMVTEEMQRRGLAVA